MHPSATPHAGRTIKLEVPARKNVPFKVQKFVQVRFASTANDGTPVFYEVDLTADSKPQVLSFGLHFPAADAQSTKRAMQRISDINR
jgi:hypothetical protein